MSIMETGGFDRTPLEDKEKARSKQERKMMSGELEDDDDPVCTWRIFGFALFDGGTSRPELGFALGNAGADPSSPSGASH
mmetsp:Transcript_30222/g.88380  ORF Transcript_30222/g.88380 Transcript_30222/m.88380 type:complete len:80 (+) Transcript_30222:1267-1506(+)